MSNRPRLTAPMVEAIMSCLCEVEAAGGLQGVYRPERDELICRKHHILALKMFLISSKQQAAARRGKGFGIVR